MPVIFPIPDSLTESADLVVEGDDKPKRVLLCEGAAGAIPIEVGYVRQGDKVWVAIGESDELRNQLCESLGSGTQIVESIDALELVEDARGEKQVKDGVWIVEGPAQRSDAKNANRRTYPKKIWEKLIANEDSYVQKNIKARGMLGHIEHPKDGRTDGKEGALLVVESKLRPDGVVWNKFELLDTPNGKILQEYTKKKVRWGVSSRGNGTVDDTGTVSTEDFVLETWDAVMRPSTTGAYPTAVNEPAPATKSGKKVQESTEPAKTTGDTPTGAASVMTEAQKVCESQVQALSRKPTEGLIVTERLQLVGECAKAVSEVEKLVKTGAPLDVAAGMLSNLSAVLSAVATLPETTLEKQVDEALEAAADTGKDKRGAAFNRVIESMQQRVAVAVEEAETLRSQLTEVDASKTAAERKLTEAVTQATAAEAKLKLVEAKLAIATAALSDLSLREVPNTVEDAVEEMIQQHPELAGHETDLLEAETPAAVAMLAVNYLTTARQPKPSVPVSPRRAALPVGLVVESEGITAAPVRSVVRDHGAQVAAAAVAHMGGGNRNG